jgi:hypothetical protein
VASTPTRPISFINLVTLLEINNTTRTDDVCKELIKL